MPPGSRSVSPPARNAAPARGRSGSAPPRLPGPARGVWLEFIERTFAVVKPNDPYNWDGNCKACAVMTAGALVNGVAPQLAGLSTDVTGGRIVGRFRQGQYDDVCECLFLATAPGGVYIIENADDHTLVVVRRADGGLYIVDSNMRIYRRAYSDADFEVPIHEGGGTFNVLTPGYEEMRIIYWGNLSGPYV